MIFAAEERIYFSILAQAHKTWLSLKHLLRAPGGKMKPTFLWYDYETFGTRPHRDRPVQFACLRTDENFQAVDEPIVLFCRPPMDRLPAIGACLVTGITPQQALKEGLPENEFATRIFRELNQPGTCSIGYNSTAFDNPLTRFLFWRNFLPPYEHEWKNDASRFDLINLSRATAAYRPSEIIWPLNDKGKTSFRLEDLTKANGISHAKAHDALDDVYALMEWGKLIHSKEPKLFEYGLALRNKDKVAAFPPLLENRIFLYTQSFFDATYFATSAVSRVAPHPQNKNSHIVFDLRQDPESLLDENIETLRQRLFSSKKDLPEGHERPALSELRINGAPFLAPTGFLKDQNVAQRLSLDPQILQSRHDRLHASNQLSKKVQALYERQPQEEKPPQEDLYGGFVSRDDQNICRRIQNIAPTELGSLEDQFDDPRLGPMLFSYRAENFLETLSDDEKIRWYSHCRSALHDKNEAGVSAFEHYTEELEQVTTVHATDARKIEVLASLADWSKTLDKNCR
jgi:exodeoxyribonuclease I